MNDNNMGDCRRCGGNSETRLVRGRHKEVITKKADPAKIAGFDAALRVKGMAKDGALYDKRR
jgi:hypothetical protein